MTLVNRPPSQKLADGENYTIDLEQGVAVIRIFRRPDLDAKTLTQQAESLLPKVRELAHMEGVTGLLLDLRRVGSGVSEGVEKAYRMLATAWEITAQPLAVLVEDSILRMQVRRIISEASPRFGGVFNDREEARRFTGAAPVRVSTLGTYSVTDRLSHHDIQIDKLKR